MGIDKVGIDKVGIDKVGITPNIVQSGNFTPNSKLSLKAGYNPVF